MNNTTVSTHSASTSPMVSNLRRIESVWRNNLTVVYPLQLETVSTHQDYLLEKTHSKNIYNTLRDGLSNILLSDELTELKQLQSYYSIVPWKRFFITTSVERQPGTGCIHFHTVMGDIVQFSIACTEQRMQYTQRFNTWLYTLLSNKLFFDTSVTGSKFGGLKIKPSSTSVSSYITESRCKTSVLSYNCKNRDIPYISSHTHRIIKMTNDIDSRSGCIPILLKRYNIPFSKNRTNQDFECRIKYVLG